MILKIQTQDSISHFNSKMQLHRDNDLPAVIYPNGTQAWYLNGKIHRDKGPAVIWSDYYRAWYQNDICAGAKYNYAT